MDSNNTPTILINNRRGGIAEDNALMREWDCAYMQNLDWRAEPTLLKLNSKVTQSYSTANWLAVAFVDWYTRCDNWKIFDSNWNQQPYTVPWTILAVIKFWINQTWYKAMYFWLYEIWWQVKAFSVPIDNLWAGAAQRWLAVNAYGTYFDYQTGTSLPFAVTTGWENATILNYEEDFIYFSVWNLVFVANAEFMTISWARLELYLRFESNISGMSLSWYLVNIYLFNGMKYFWQWIQNRTTTWSIDLWIKNVTAINWAWNYDYVVAVGASPETNCLFISQWQSIQLLKEWSFLLDWLNELRKFHFMPWTVSNTWATHNHNLSFFPVETDDWVWVLSFWARNEIVDKAWINEYVTTVRYDLWAMTFAWDANYSPSLFFGLRDQSTWLWYVYLMSFRKDPTPQYQWEWVRYTKKYVQPRTQQSTITRFRFRYDCPATCTIEIAYAINWSSDYTVLWTLPQAQLDFEWINLAWRTDPRYEIQFRIKMTSSLDTTTPKLYTMECYDSNTSR